MYHLNTFDIPKHEGVNKWAGGGRRIQKTTRKCNEIKRISTFASSKTNSDNAKKKRIFYCHREPSNSSADITWGMGGGFNPSYGGRCFLLVSNLHPYCNQSCTFLLLAESITFLHITTFLSSIFFVKFCSTLKLILDPPLLSTK